MLTRCPACSTTFRVQPEQLKARQGKVRCGECQQVFSALDSLIEEFVLPPSTSASDDDESRRLADSAFSPAEYLLPDGGAVTSAGHLRPDGLPVPKGDAISPGLTFAAIEPEPIVQGDEVSELRPLGEDRAIGTTEVADPLAQGNSFEEAVSEPTVAIETLGLDAATDFDALKWTASDDITSAAEPAMTEAADLTDVAATTAEAQAPAAIETPALFAPESVVTALPSDEFEPALHTPPSASAGVSTWLWAGGVVFAIVALMLQGLMIFRVEIATMAPQTRHIFVTACDLVGCTVDLPKKIELLSIESSDLHPDPSFPDQAGRLGVQLSLRNRAPFAQTWPHLELSLTDTTDTVIVRRVFTAKDYLIARAPTEAMLAQGIGAREDVALELALDVGELVATGYRLYLFYP